MFFFTDLDKLTTQVASQAFGPVAGEEEHKFLVTNRFSVQSGAKAYCVLAGSILVQPVDNDPASPTVNVALRPINSIVNGYTPVSFVIYICIKKSSIIDQYGDVVKRVVVVNYQ